MTYQPVVPASGSLGWAFLKRTQEAQQEAFGNSDKIARDAAYFLDKISDVTQAEEIVSDRRLLSVALGAFGLDEDIGNKFFIQKVLSEGSLDSEAFANRLSDKRYLELAEAFGFDLSPPNTALSDFGARIVSQFKERQFEVAVGEQNSDLRLALGVERQLDSLAQKALSEDAAWFTVMGTPPVRRVFEMALGLPSQLAAIDLDQQLKEFKEKSQTHFGTTDPSEFSSPELRKKLVQRFLLQSDIQTNTASSRGSIALSLLQSLTPLV